jgi:hypothetical protein
MGCADCSTMGGLRVDCGRDCGTVRGLRTDCDGSTVEN